MTAARRRVLVSEAFFDEVDRLFPDVRGPNGEPSASDFVAFELPSIIDHVADRFDVLPEAIPGLGALRSLMLGGTLVRIYLVHALEVDDETVRLVHLAVDR